MYGELQTKTNSSTGDVTTYSTDAFGNLKSVTLPGATVIEYVTDGKDRRVQKKINGVLQRAYLYEDQLRIAAEIGGSGVLVSRFVYGTKSNIPEYLIKNGDTYKIVSDQLGSPRLIVKVSDGSIAQQIDYDEFGRVLADTNPGFQPFGYAGGLYDPDTKLVHFGARGYDPETGRWLSKDPILFAGGDTNLYGYVLNDPVNLIDPAGLEAACDFDGCDGPLDNPGGVGGGVGGGGRGAGGASARSGNSQSWSSNTCRYTSDQSTLGSKPLGENWEFPPGAEVVCEVKTIDGDEVLVAIGYATEAH